MLNGPSIGNRQELSQWMVADDIQRGEDAMERAQEKARTTRRVLQAASETGEDPNKIFHRIYLGETLERTERGWATIQRDEQGEVTNHTPLGNQEV